MEEVLIGAVYKREPLWNPSNKLYKNVPVVKSLWKEVAEEINNDEKTVRAKWKNLRTYFNREMTKIEKPKSGDAAEDTTSSWKYLKQMMFLKDKVSAEKRYSNITQQDSDLNSIDESQDGISSPLSTSNSVPETTRPKKKIKPMSSAMAQRDEKIFEFEKKKLEILENERLKDNDDDMLFFQSLLPFMKQIPGLKKLKLRSKIQDLVIKELDGIENERSTQYMETQSPVINLVNNADTSQQNYRSDPSQPDNNHLILDLHSPETQLMLASCIQNYKCDLNNV